MEYEKIDQSLSNSNINSIGYVDKLITFKSLVKILLFFSIQEGILMLQINRIFNISGYYTTSFWNYNISILLQVIINYSVFGFLLLLIFAFYLGKELKMKRKEKYIMFIFKGLIISVIFLLINGLFIYLFILAFYLAKTGNPVTYDASSYFTSGPILELLFLWFFIVFFYVLIKISLLFIHLFTSRNLKTKNSYIINQQGFVNQPVPQPNYNRAVGQQSVQTQINPATSSSSNVVAIESKNNNNIYPKNDVNLTKEQIRQMQSEKISEFKAEQKKSKATTQVENATKIKEIRAKTPLSIINFFEKHLFNQSLLEQGIIFFTITQFFWLVMLTLDIFINTNGFTNYSFYSILSAVDSYSIAEFILYAVSSIFYYDILRGYFKLPSNKVNEHVIGLLVIGIGLIFLSSVVGSYFLTPSSSILLFIILKFIILLIIPAFYFGYKSQNQTKSDSFVKINPIFAILYNKSMNELRSNEKSSEIIKKFLQTHKEDIKRSLLDATPINFKDNIKTVIISDYDRLETLLAYNNVSVKSKIALIDYSMEIFSTFLINLEVNLQDIYTEHLLNSSQENLHKPIGNEFIESKFAKLFSQWESL